MFFIKYFILLIALVASQSEIKAWGPIGHRVVAQIADQHISAQTKAEIQKLLGKQSMVVASNWMDEIRSDEKAKDYGDWHWVTIPDGETYGQTEKNKDGDIIMALHLAVKILKSDTNTEIKCRYLKFLIHIMADLHQPLHIGNGGDAGGNAVKIKWFYDYSDLHSIWDSRMIESKKWSYSELAENLQEEFDFSEEEQNGTIEDWAHEAMQYRTQIYSIENKSYLGYDYMYKNWSLVKNQLWKAGVRLAGILDEFFS